jgi:predicted nucleic acid-binding Zn ribbon protein
MDDPQPTTCEVCGAGPLELVLYPVAVHYKGSGFYATDYGRRARKAKDGDSPDSGGPAEKKDEKKDQKKEEKKPAEA